MHDLGVALAAAGHEVTYVTMRHWDDAPPVIEGVEIVGLVPAGKVYAEGRRSLGPPVRFGLAVGRYLIRHGHRFDVVHTAAFPFFPMLAAGLARRRAGYRLVADWYEVWSRRYWRRYAGRLVGTVGWLVQRRCVRMRHRAFCISQLTERRLLEEGFAGEHAVLPGLYAGPFDRRRAASSSPSSCTPVATSPEKRVPVLVEAFALARRAAPSLRLVLYGDGPTRQRAPRNSRPASGSETLSSFSVADPRRRSRTLRTSGVRRDRLGAGGLWAHRRRGSGTWHAERRRRRSRERVDRARRERRERCRRRRGDA